MNTKEKPIQHHRFYYNDSDSEYDTDIQEDEEYNSRPDIKDVKKENPKPIKKKLVRKNIKNMFDSDTD